MNLTVCQMVGNCPDGRSDETCLSLFCSKKPDVWLVALYAESRRLQSRLVASFTFSAPYEGSQRRVKCLFTSINTAQHSALKNERK